MSGGADKPLASPLPPDAGWLAGWLQSCHQEEPNVGTQKTTNKQTQRLLQKVESFNYVSSLHICSNNNNKMATRTLEDSDQVQLQSAEKGEHVKVSGEESDFNSQPAQWLDGGETVWLERDERARARALSAATVPEEPPLARTCSLVMWLSVNEHILLHTSRRSSQTMTKVRLIALKLPRLPFNPISVNNKHIHHIYLHMEPVDGTADGVQRGHVSHRPGLVVAASNKSLDQRMANGAAQGAFFTRALPGCSRVHRGLPADAALPGQRAAWRGRRRLVGVGKLRTFEVQNDLGHRTTQGEYARPCTPVHTQVSNTPDHNVIMNNRAM